MYHEESAGKPVVAYLLIFCTAGRMKLRLAKIMWEKYIDNNIKIIYTVLIE